MDNPNSIADRIKLFAPEENQTNGGNTGKPSKKNWGKGNKKNRRSKYDD